MKLKVRHLVGFVALASTLAYGASQLGRNSKITYPDLGDPAGAAQVNTQQAAVEFFSDDDNSRYRVGTAIADSTLTTFDHDFGVAFTELNILLYTGTHPSLTRVPDPAGAGWTIAANGGSPLTKIDVTTPGSGGPHTFAVIVIQGRGAEDLDDLDDVDVTTTAPEDGQALVFDSGSSDWIPGASGDSSFKCQSVTDPNVSLKSGFVILDSGVELNIATDLVVDLDTVLGSSPVNATTYYLYVDLDLVPSASLLANGRQVRAVSSAIHFSLQTVLPDSVLLSRYVPICLIKSADAGTVWSGTGSDFATLAIRRHGRPIVNVSPTAYELSKQSVGSVGSVDNEQQALSAADFPGAASATSFFSLEDLNDDSSNARNLTNNGSLVFTAEGMLGRSVANFDGDDDYLRSTDSHFNPGNGVDWSVGGWFRHSWDGSATPILISSTAGASTQFGYDLFLVASGVTFRVSDDGTNLNSFVAPTDFGPGELHHLAMVYDFSATTLYGYIDGQPVGSVSATNTHLVSTDVFTVGAFQTAASNHFVGSAEDIFFSNGQALTEAEINAIYSRRYRGGQINAGHVLTAESFPPISTTDNLAFFNLAADADNDNGVVAYDLTNNNSTPFDGYDIFGVSGAANLLTASTNYFSSTNAFFNPGNDVSIVMGGWYKLPDWTPSAAASIIAQQQSGADRGFAIDLQTNGDIAFLGTDSAGSHDVNETVTDPGFADGSWHHLVWMFDFEEQLLKAYIDGELAGSAAMTNQRAITSPHFSIGALHATPVSPLTGVVQDAFFANFRMTTEDIRKIYSARLDHNMSVLVGDQQWFGQFYKGDNSTIVNELTQGWLVDKQSDFLFIDSSLEPGDSISLRLQNQSFDATTVPISVYNSGKLTSAPSLPITHGLGCRPKDFFVLHEGASVSGDDDKRYDLLSADGTEITGDLSSLTVDASHRVQIIASCAPIAAVVDIPAYEVSNVTANTQNSAFASQSAEVRCEIHGRTVACKIPEVRAAVTSTDSLRFDASHVPAAFRPTVEQTGACKGENSAAKTITFVTIETGGVLNVRQGLTQVAFTSGGGSGGIYACTLVYNLD